MKKAVKWLIIIVVLVGIGGGVYAYVSSQNNQPLYTTVSASVQDLVQTVEATGSVSSTEDLNLSFKRSGKIDTINIDVGDTVTQGQVLASIIDESLLSEVDRAHAAVQSAQSDLERIEAGATPEAIAVKEQSVEKARVALRSAQSELDNVLHTQIESTTVYIDTGLQDITDALFVANYTLNVVYDGILDSEAQAVFNTTNSNALSAAGNQYSISINNAAVASSKHQLAISSQSVSDTLAALQSTRSALDGIVILLDESLKTLNAGIATPYFTQATIDALKTSFNTRASAIAAEKSSIQTSINNLTTGLQALKATVDTTTFAVQTAENNLSLAEAEYSALVAPAEAYDIRQQQARLLQAQADLRSAESKLADVYVAAPTNGIITAVDKKVGENVSLNEPALHMIGDSRLQIDVDISESDINKVRVDLPADITLDAFGSDKHFNGRVSFIEPSERVIQDVVYYRVTVVFTEDNPDIKPGMTADVTIKTAERKNVIALPLRAVMISPSGEKSIRILQGETPIEKTVTTGIRGDDGSIEVLSGVNEGDVIITGENSAK